MMKFAYQTGAKLNALNRQNLTPLTLAAKLAKKRVKFYLKGRAIKEPKTSCPFFVDIRKVHKKWSIFCFYGKF